MQAKLMRRNVLPQLLAFFLRVRWIPRNVGRLAIKEVWNEDLVMVLLVAVGKDVGAL